MAQLRRERKHEERLALDKTANLLGEAARVILPYSNATADELHSMGETFRKRAQKILEYGGSSGT